MRQELVTAIEKMELRINELCEELKVLRPDLDKDREAYDEVATKCAILKVAKSKAESSLGWLSKA